MNEKMWSILVHLSTNMWSGAYNPELVFDEDVWDTILKESQKAGINTIVLDIGDGVQFGSHPEIAVKGAWTRKRVRAEIARLREMGIALIPKLNFATVHDEWLGEYNRMVSTTTYYKVCNDLIKEAYELFEKPEYIHLGMDEEDAKYCKNYEFALYRQGELYWHDLRFLTDCVRDTGAKPWIWSSPLFDHPEEYKKHIAADELLISPYHYNAVRKEHYTPIDTWSEYLVYYNEGEYANMGIKYVEEDPFLVRFMEIALPLMKQEGYNYVPTVSTYNKCPYNTPDLLEYFKENAPDNQVIGFMTAPWRITTKEFEHEFIESLRLLKDAKEKFYNLA